MQNVTRGPLTFLAYTLIFGSASWARSTTKDIAC
jgi:hypothetical protein